MDVDDFVVYLVAVYSIEMSSFDCLDIVVVYVVEFVAHILKDGTLFGYQFV